MRNLPETVHEYNISKLNLWFIFGSLLLLGSVGWMLWDDYMREWKPYQRQAKLFERQRLLQDRAAAEKRMEEGGFAAVTNNLAKATALFERGEAKRRGTEYDLARVESDLGVQKIRYATAKAKLDEVKSRFDEAVELRRGGDVLRERRRILRKQEELVASEDAKVQMLEEKKMLLQKTLAEAAAEKVHLDKEVFRLTTERGLIEKRLKYVESKILPALLDQPLVEFAQPTVSVRQVIAEDMTYSLNFVDVPRIDRCITCHTFADKKDSLAEGEEGFRFANLPQPWRSHPRLDLFVSPDTPHKLERFGCSTCHAGWDRGTTFIHAAHTPSFYATKADFVKMPLVEGVPYWTSVASIEKWKPGLLDKVREHTKVVEDLAGLKQSKFQDKEKIQATRATRDQLRAELKTAYGLEREQLSQFQFASLSQEQAWEHPPLHWHPMHHKEDPMRPREFVESSCLKCHSGVTDIPTKRDPAGSGSDLNVGDRINMGLRLVEQAGCYACHKMQALETVVKYKVKDGDTLQAIAHSKVADPQAILNANGMAKAADVKAGVEIDIPVRVPYPKPGPSLLKIASKTSKDWMEKWLEHPKGFRANTFMPQFWNLDNNRDITHFQGTLEVDDKPLTISWKDRNAVEIAAITEYVFGLSETQDYPAPPAGDVTRGEKLVNNIGCMGCHVVDQKLGELAFKDRVYRSRGPMLSGSGSKYKAGWLYAWLKDPAQYRHDTRMPSLRLSDQEAADIAAFLMGNHNAEFDARSAPEVNPQVLLDTAVEYKKNSMPLTRARKEAEAMSDAEKLQFLGDKLVQRYGCMNCHNVKGMENAKPISIELSDWASKSPTKLDFGFVEIPHNNYSFLHQKLQAPRSVDRVETKRPQELLRMPQYNFSEEQIEMIMTAVMGMTGENASKSRRVLTENEWYVENGRWLIKELNCLGCHVNEGEPATPARPTAFIGRGGAIRSTMDEEKAFMYPPSLTGVGTKVRPAWLHAFLKHPGDYKFRYWMDIRMPTYRFTDDQVNSLVQYFALRDKQPWPFESDTMGVPTHPSREMIEAGAKIVNDAGCMACHQVRTPEAAAAAGNPAVNLSQVAPRMRPKGLMDWLHNPAGVTPGVAMPGFWTEGQPSPLPDILGGDSDKQIQAVAAYLESIGNSGGSPASATASGRK